MKRQKNKGRHTLIGLGRASVETKGPIGVYLDTVGRQFAGISAE